LIYAVKTILDVVELDLLDRVNKDVIFYIVHLSNNLLSFYLIALQRFLVFRVLLRLVIYLIQTTHHLNTGFKIHLNSSHEHLQQNELYKL
jgi:hypothetical protein